MTIVIASMLSLYYSCTFESAARAGANRLKMVYDVMVALQILCSLRVMPQTRTSLEKKKLNCRFYIVC